MPLTIIEIRPGGGKGKPIKPVTESGYGGGGKGKGKGKKGSKK